MMYLLAAGGHEVAAGCHLALELRHLLGQLGLEGLREAAEQTGRQLLLHVLLVLHLQGRQRLSESSCGRRKRHFLAPPLKWQHQDELWVVVLRSDEN